MAEMRPTSPVETRSSSETFSGKRSWIRRAIRRTCGRCSRMSRSRSSSPMVSETAKEYIGFPQFTRVWLGHKPSSQALAGENHGRHPGRRDFLQVFRNALSRGEERERHSSAHRFVENRAERSSLVQFGEHEPLRLEYLVGIHHARKIGRFDGSRQC